MFSEMVTRTQNGLKQSAVWSVVVWSLVFNLVLFAVFAIMGIHASLTSLPTPLAIGHLVGVSLLMLLVIVLAGPYWIAAIYGTLAEAANGQSITWGSFWQNGRKMYGRAWGLIGFSLLWAIGLMVIAMIFGAILHALAILVVILWIIISLPVLIRMTGGLFSRQLTWGQSFAQSFQSAGWGILWLAMAVYAIASIIILLLVSLILGHIPLLGSILVLFVDVILEVVGGIWAFAAYEVATPTIQ